MIFYLKNDQGFSLIEIIVGLVVFTILATLLYSFLGSNLQDSSLPITRLQNTMAIQRVMEDIRADHKANKNLATLKTAIDSGSFGSYTVVQNSYIKFSGASEVADSTDLDLLKVTLKNATGDLSLTLLLSNW